MHTPLTEQNIYGHLMTIDGTIKIISTLPKNSTVVSTLSWVTSRIWAIISLTDSKNTSVNPLDAPHLKYTDIFNEWLEADNFIAFIVWDGVDINKQSPYFIASLLYFFFPTPQQWRQMITQYTFAKDSLLKINDEKLGEVLNWWYIDINYMKSVLIETIGFDKKRINWLIVPKINS
jgi:uncharacterized protein YjeT (DUF2065 family)